MAPPPAPNVRPDRPARPRVAVLAAGVVGVVASAAQAQTPRFDLIQPAPGEPFSIVTSLLDDGRAGGYSFGRIPSIPWGRPFLWSPQDGRTDFDPPAGLEATTAQFSADGSAYVGGPAIHQRMGGATTEIPAVPGFPDIDPKDISRDGRVVVGNSQFSSFGSTIGVPFIWREGQGTIALPPLPTGSFLSEAFAVSDDGRFVAGGGNLGGPDTVYAGWLWNETSGYTILPNQDGTFGNSVAYGVSNDGRVAVGATTLGRAARWVDGQIELLGTLPNALATEARGTSDDGDVIAGTVFLENNTSTGFIWTASTGMMFADDYLTLMQLNVPDGLGLKRLVVSADGMRFGGLWSSSDPDRPSRGFVAVIPGPGTAMAGLLLAPLAARRRR